MNIFKKYKSNFLAVIVSLTFYVILFLLLNIIPSANQLSKIEDDIKNQDAIDFQVIQEIPLPEPSEITKVVSNKTSVDPINKEVKQSDDTRDIEETNDLSQDDEQTNIVQNPDSVMLAQLKKTLTEFKEIVPKDSLEKNVIQQKATQKIQQTIANNTPHYSEEEWQFLRNNYRTIQSIKRVYPYVLKTKEIVDNLNKQLVTITNNQEKHRLIKKTEKELFQQFEKDVRKMSYSQGKLLLKLIARETNQTAYGLIKTYKGGIPATFWYGVGLIFREDLKVKYDSIGEDAVLEQIIKKYKIGKLY